ncbi:UDP-glucose 4-epimerase GalE [Cognatiluteimonas weifangensis]|uniref:UDP-glucose 4-epimerase n=1 Tax=Cognatiluteimonas weifangensis TaxID=2303539 RepID=A0A372DJ44_9GAMM|nr:UDP-glucose 4-epimerase GalE [Luteimonas weifangensis]RFP59549.1 UDP-glucose 4-epimerase GalE [Luteimonas weifangensis]
MRILVCGGAGYIGSHACVVLAGLGHRVVVVDNFVNSSPRTLPCLQRIIGAPVEAHRLDLRDRDGLRALLAGSRFDAVMHFAALKAVGESCAQPLDYFDNNIGGTIALLQAMQDTGVRRLVFSSSATVYGEPEQVPVREDAPLSATNPYGRTKLVMEQMIGDLCRADPAFRAASLRYFNPVGAHPSGLIGEDPCGVPNNLMPYLCQVAAGRRERLRVFGGDYPTADGTGVRDYLHVMDLARAHADALDYLVRRERNLVVNLGTGRGTSVLELVRAFERVSGRRIPCEIVARRPGDVATLYADPARARRLLGWRARLGVPRMCRDAWHWQSLHPRGYADADVDAPAFVAGAGQVASGSARNKRVDATPRPPAGPPPPSVGVRTVAQWSSTTTSPRPGR